MKRYFWQQLSTLWFDRYLICCGAILNSIAVFSLAQALLPRSQQDLERRYNRARIELENGPLCDQMMANAEFTPGREFDLQLTDRSKLKISYKDKGTNALTKEGHQIHMVDMDRVGFLFFEVDDKQIVRRCIPLPMLECVTADGSFDKNGECLVSIHLPSDCEVMNGALLGDRCRVPPGRRILKPAARATASQR